MILELKERLYQDCTQEEKDGYALASKDLEVVVGEILDQWNPTQKRMASMNALAK